MANDTKNLSTRSAEYVDSSPNIRISNPRYSTFRRVLYSRSRKQHQILSFRADVQLRVDARILRCRKSNFDNGILAPHVTDFDISWAVPLTTMGFPSRGHSHHLFIYSSNANWSYEITSRTCFFLHVCHHHMRSAFKGTRKRCVSHTAAQITSSLPCFEFSAILGPRHSTSPYAPPLRVTVE